MTEAGPFERLLTLHIGSAELRGAEERAARKLSKDLKIKGFRPGKAPRRIVEPMVGAERIRNEALEDALPDLVGEALREHELAPAVAPSVSATRDTGDGVEVDVKVTLWPKVESLPAMGGRRIVVDPIEVDDEDVDTQVDRLRNQYAELEEVDRPAGDGDFVMVDLGATRLGQPLEDASATDLLYEVGSGSFLPEIDEPLRGSAAGHIHQVDADLPAARFGEDAAGPAQVRILVKGVRAKRLPEVNDDWVADVTEFDTVEELRGQLAESLAGYKRMELAGEVQSRLMDELLDELDLELPEALVVAEMDRTAHNFVHRLEQQGIELAQYLEITGQDEDSFIADLRSQAVRNLRTRILLDAVVEQEGIEIEADEVTAAIDGIAASVGQPADEYRQRLLEAGQVQALVGDMLRQKAIDHLVGQVKAVDPDGNEVALDAPAGSEPEVEEAGAEIAAEREVEAESAEVAE